MDRELVVIRKWRTRTGHAYEVGDLVREEHVAEARYRGGTYVRPQRAVRDRLAHCETKAEAAPEEAPSEPVEAED